MANILETFLAWPVTKKATLIGTFALSVGIIAGLVMFANQIDYQVLYSSLSQEDAASIAGKLREYKTPFRLDGSGTTVLVPADSLYEIRLKLAGDGLPQGGGVGFEVFDRTGFGMTEFLQKVNFRRALQGELARTIRQFPEVRASRVHLSIPEKTIFSDGEEKAKASVVLSLVAGRTLDERQIQGIVHLVASSVEGLSPSAVSVLSDSGELLNKPRNDNDSVAAYTSENMSAVQGVARAYEERIQSMLDGVVGSGNAIVRVDVKMDFRRVERTEETFDPDAVAVREEHRTKETSTSKGPGGIPGVVSNVPGGGGGARGSSSGSQRQNESTTYEVSKVVSRIVEPVGEIKRLSVAVMVDGTYEPDGDGAMVYKARGAEEIARLEGLVKTAIGFDQARGDQVMVTNVPFQRPSADLAVEEPGVDYLQYLPLALKFILPIIGLLVVYLMVLRPMVASLKRGVPAPQVRLPGTVAHIEQSLALGAPEGAEPAAEEGAAGYQAPRERITELTREQPDRTVQVIREWIAEES